MNQQLETAPQPGPKTARMMQLDVLRGVAIALVMCRHAVVPWSLAGPVRPLVKHLYYLGWTGVDLFFVLSGFLIGGLLFKEIRTTGRLDIPRFLLRRGLKIWPAYFVLIGFVFVYLIWPEHAAFSDALRQIAPNLLHLQNYLGSPRGITWSLAVEEHFYLVLPLFLLIVTGRWARTRSIQAVPLVAVLLIVGCTAMRVVFNWHRPFEMFTDLAPTHLRIDGLFLGVLLAYLYHMHHPVLARVARHRALLVCIGLALVLPLSVSELGEHAFAWTVGFTMLYLGYACILVAAVFAAPGDGLLGRALASPPARVLAWVGVFSYSIYLWHTDVGFMIERHLLRHLPHHPLTLYWASATAVYLVLAVLVGAAMAKTVEMPVLAIRDRLFPSRVSSPVLPPAARVELTAAEQSSAVIAPALVEPAGTA